MISGLGNSRLVLVALSIPVIGLLGALAAILLYGDVKPIPPSQTAFAAWDADDYDPASVEPAVLQRPLLWSSRRPLAPVVAQPSSTEDSNEDKGPTKAALAGYRLAGMFHSDLDAGVIVVGPKKRTRLVVGDEIDGWMLEEVKADTAIFVSRSGATRRASVRLEHMLAAGGNAQPGKTSSNARATSAKEPEGRR
jgi:hypothetical protein